MYDEGSMPKSVFFVGVVALTGVASFYGCGESQGDHPPVLNVVNGGNGYVSASGGSGGGSGGASGSGSGGASGSGSGGSSGSGADGGDSGGSSGSSSGGSDGSADGPVCPGDNNCNPLTLCGAKVSVTNQTGPFNVSPMGGNILAGTYVLSEIDYYPASNGDAGPGLGWQRQVIQLTPPDGGSSATLQYATVVEADTITLQTQSGSASTSGQVLTVNYGCPQGIPEFVTGYTATATTLSYVAQPLVYTYTKQ